MKNDKLKKQSEEEFKVMNIKSNSIAAESFSMRLQVAGSDTGNRNVEYAGESTIAAVKNGKSQYQTEQSTASAYHAALLSDAEHIRSLGEEFVKIDAAIVLNVGKCF